MLLRYKYSDLSLIFNVLWVLIFCVYLLFWQVIYAVHQDLFKSDLASDLLLCQMASQMSCGKSSDDPSDCNCYYYSSGPHK